MIFIGSWNLDLIKCQPVYGNKMIRSLFPEICVDLNGVKTVFFNFLKLELRKTLKIEAI
jgi:hypothetical protein